jgi:formylmethanofuran dehydrogenase subunit B
MDDAWIDGEPVALDAAIAQGARLLTQSRFPVIAGLGTDMAGARAAVALARRLRGAVDHMHADGLLRDLDAMRSGGVMLTTPSEARVRADVLLLVGPALVDAWPELPARLFGPPTATEIGDAVERRVYWLCPGKAERTAHGARIETIGRDAAALPALLAALRARVAGRPVAKTSVPSKAIEALAEALKAARFGVAVWSAARLDALGIAMLCGLVDDLNARTRFSGLPLAPGDNALGANQACGWMTGLPVRTGFARGYPEHDPWRFDAIRLVEGGEADAALWISAYTAAAPKWRRAVPTVALTAGDAPMRAQVRIAVGRPGEEHDAVAYSALTGTLVSTAANIPGRRITVAEALARIGAAPGTAGV